MIDRYVLGASLAVILSGCQASQSPSSGFRSIASDDPSNDGSSDGGQDSDGGVWAGIDPTVAHFFNTATLANDEAAVVAASQDGGANADAGN